MIALNVVNYVGIPVPKVAAMERAVTIQANGAFRQYWNTQKITFNAAGIPVYIETAAQVQKACGANALGCHGKTNGPAPTSYIVLSTQGGVSVNLSHEILETLADPLGASRTGGHLREICDPVENNTYTIDGVAVSDYVTPAWYQRGAPGRTDFMRKIR